jgi:hypothetical protein
MVQIHLGFGRKFLSVGVDQERSSMIDDWVDRIGEVFYSPTKLFDGWVNCFSKVFTRQEELLITDDR